MWTVDTQIDRLGADACILACLQFRVTNNFITDALEIMDLFPRQVQEFTPLMWVCLACRLADLARLWHAIDQLQYQRSASDNASATRQKVAPNNVLEHTAFSGRLAA